MAHGWQMVHMGGTYTG